MAYRNNVVIPLALPNFLNFIEGGEIEQSYKGKTVNEGDEVRWECGEQHFGIAEVTRCQEGKLNFKKVS